MITFSVVGPFKLIRESRTEYGFGGKKDPDKFLAARQSIGCYVFATLRNGKYDAWYVARTARAFGTEVLTEHKQKVLAQIRELVPDPKLFLFLIVLEGEPSRSGHKALQEMKLTLTKAFRAKNPQFLGKERDTASSWDIAKVTDAERGETGSPASIFRGMF